MGWTETWRGPSLAEEGEGDGESLEARCFSVSLGVLFWSLCHRILLPPAALSNPSGLFLRAEVYWSMLASSISADVSLET